MQTLNIDQAITRFDRAGIQQILALPLNSNRRKIFESSATKINSFIKGFVQRIKFRKTYFVYMCTGKKQKE